MDDEDYEYIHDECTKSRKEKDNSDESSTIVSLKQKGVVQGGDTVWYIINKDLDRRNFVDKRLYEHPDSDHHLKPPIQRNKARTCSSSYEVGQSFKCKPKLIKVY